MIISIKLHATKEQVAEVRARIEEFGYKVHSIEGEERVVIGAVGHGRCHRLPGIAGGHAPGGESRAYLSAV